MSVSGKSSPGMQGQGKASKAGNLSSSANSLKPYKGIACSDGFGSSKKASVQTGIAGGLKRK